MDTATCDVLKLAHAIIDDGWTQGAFQDDKGHCLIGAVNAACDSLFMSGYPLRLAFIGPIDVLKNKIYTISGNRSIASWNDNPSRTKEQVLELIEDVVVDCSN